MGVINNCVTIGPIRIVLEKENQQYEGYIYSRGVNLELANAAAKIAANTLKDEHLLFDSWGNPFLSVVGEELLEYTVDRLTSMWFNQSHEKGDDLRGMYAHYFRAADWPYLTLSDICRIEPARFSHTQEIEV